MEIWKKEKSEMKLGNNLKNGKREINKRETVAVGSVHTGSFLAHIYDCRAMQSNLS